MGGKALKNIQTIRCTREEFDLISAEIVNVLNKTFTKIGIPLFYQNKKTFGDIDIVISMDELNQDMREYITNNFHPTEIFHNGNCWSFDYRNVQIDFITTSKEHFSTTLFYMNYNDLGNFVGRLAHGFGLRYGQEGLWYEHQFKGRNIGTIQISKNYEKIFEFLGISFERYSQGFNDLEDIFTFIAESPYFNWKRFQLEELNKVNRDRNKKRASYASFLEWMAENVADENHEYKFAEDKTSYFIKINDFFPEANIITEVRRLEYLECRKLYIQSKFNGGDVMRKYGFEGKKLGDVLTGFNKYITDEIGSYSDYIIHTDTFEIYSDFEDYLRTIKEVA